MTDIDADLAALIAESVGDNSPTADGDDTLVELRARALQFRELKDRKASLDAESKDLSKQLDTIEKRIKGLMELAGSSSMRIAGVGLLFLQTDPYPSIHDPEGFIAWCDDNGLSHMAKRTVHSATARSFWKQSLESGTMLPPPEIADAVLMKSVRLRK
jgi:hypothetical protein